MSQFGQSFRSPSPATGPQVIFPPEDGQTHVGSRQKHFSSPTGYVQFERMQRQHQTASNLHACCSRLHCNAREAISEPCAMLDEGSLMGSQR